MVPVEDNMLNSKFYKSSIYDNGFYKYAVEFEKAFNKGNLQGLTIKDRLHFVDRDDAEKWIQAVIGLDKDQTFFNFKVVKAI